MFIEILEKTLKEKGTNLSKMSKEIGIAQSPTSRWKKGSLPSIEVLVKICKYLNVSADYLLELEIEPPPDRANRLTEQEQLLVECYRTADERGQEDILEKAQREAERNKKQETLSNLKIS